MSIVQFDQLPASARLWIFGCAKLLAEEQVQRVCASMDAFLQQWTAHNRQLATAWQLRYNQFIFVGVDEQLTGVSGCSIDSLVHHLRKLERELGLEIVNTSSKIFYRDTNGAVQCVSRDVFRNLIEDHAVDEDTIVFNNVLQTVEELQEPGWEVPMKASWHGEAIM
ncbi:MAG: hypothetical protein ACE5HO_20075 [bacterium]